MAQKYTFLSEPPKEIPFIRSYAGTEVVGDRVYAGFTHLKYLNLKYLKLLFQV